MKRKIILAFVFLSLFLTSCSDSANTPTDILYECIGQVEQCPTSNIYFSEAEAGCDEYIDEGQLKKLYNGMSPASLSVSFALLLSKDDSIYEVHIYKAKSQLNAEEIEKILYRRVEMIQKKDIYLYDEENFENISASAKVYKKGRYVALIITDNNDSFEKVIKKMT